MLTHALMLVMLLWQSASPVATGQVRGVVVEDGGGRPVVSARVRLLPTRAAQPQSAGALEATTDQNGRFAFVSDADVSDLRIVVRRPPP